jgi:ferredoxin
MPTISFSDSDLTIEVEAGSALVDACEANDAPVDFSCTVGACATCVIVIEAGADNANAPDGDEISTASSATDVAGARLACQVTVNGDMTVRYVG